ncbi:P-loop containing nucleoside triphosphate hydrolase protein [Chytridium lagenaria]|nr:P-loop containing nucleoside triphosphate hydrolase protein [Chytridium lagenaria]
MNVDEVEFALKVLVVGNGCVGKSNNWVDYSEVEIPVPGQNGKVRLMLWDTAGQEEFDPVTRSYYENAHAVVLAFSTTDRDSFETIRAWREKVEAVCDDLCMVLVQNKIDLLERSVVSNEEAEALARDMKLKFYRVLSKTLNYHLFKVFSYLGELFFKRQNKKANSAPTDIKQIRKTTRSMRISNHHKEKKMQLPATISNNFTASTEALPLEAVAELQKTELPKPASTKQSKKPENCIVS